MSFFRGGHWYPCFGFLVTSPLGFKARVGSALFAFCGGECNVHSPRSTSGATCADLLVAGAQPVTSPHACAEVGLGSDSNGQSPGQKTNAPATYFALLVLNNKCDSWTKTSLRLRSRFKKIVFEDLNIQWNKLTDWYGCCGGLRSDAATIAAILLESLLSLRGGGRTSAAGRGTHGACTTTQPSLSLRRKVFKYRSIEYPAGDNSHQIMLIQCVASNDIFFKELTNI